MMKNQTFMMEVFMIPGARVRLLDACIPILRVDIPVSQFLLPYTVHAALDSGTSASVDSVKAEVPSSPASSMHVMYCGHRHGAVS